MSHEHILNPKSMLKAISKSQRKYQNAARTSSDVQQFSEQCLRVSTTLYFAQEQQRLKQKQ